MQQAIPDTNVTNLQDVTPSDTLDSFDESFYVGDLFDSGRRQEMWDASGDFLAQNIPSLLSALVTIVILYLLYRLIFRLLRGALRRTVHVRLGLETLVMQFFRLVALGTIGIITLDQAGLEVATILTGVGIAGIALSFAARDTLENIISGVSLLADAAFRIRDFVIIEDTYGTVQDITLRATRIQTRKNEILIVPNKVMANAAVLNHSTSQNLRVDLPFSIGYDEDPKQAREVILALVDDDKRLREDTPSKVVVTRLADSGVDMELWIYPKGARYERALIYDYTERILNALREADIEIPYPHVHLKTDQETE